jgi:hypothetical protein
MDAAEYLKRRFPNGRGEAPAGSTGFHRGPGTCRHNESDASELAKIVASEPGGNREEPFGTKAKRWIAKNIGKAADGTWKAGIAVATKVLTEAALKYYGLK